MIDAVPVEPEIAANTAHIGCKIWYYGNGYCVPVAQWIEHSPSKRMVAGSSPVRHTQV